jgi:hypothetical protein
MNSKYFQVLLNFMLFSSKEIIFMLGGRILGILDVVIETSVGITLL